MTAVTATPMTTAEFLALPDDGVERWLVAGELKEWPTPAGVAPMTVRNRYHTRVTTRVAQHLANWLDAQPEPRGEVHTGEAGCRLRREPDTTVGIDVVYISAELAGHQPDDTTLIDGVPILAVEILSPNQVQEEIDTKVDLYLEVGVLLVWVVHPHRRTVTIYRPDAEPVLVNAREELTAEPHLPGFRVPVARLFG